MSKLNVSDDGYVDPYWDRDAWKARALKAEAKLASLCTFVIPNTFIACGEGGNYCPACEPK